MSTPQPPLSPEQKLAQQQRERTDKLMRNIAIGGVIVFPIIAFMPPRKLDWYTFGLGVGFYLSADHLINVSTGKSIYENLSFSNPSRSLPTERAREMQRQLQEKELREQGRDAMRGLSNKDEKKTKGFLQKVWMGSETEGWKERRMRVEKDALESGKTYSSIILDQIWEVWNWDKDEKDTKDEPKKD
ncbi:hypothetical protein K469DRAFT_712998 [Zopfia rhizophila CBS 207.26]|uniref:Uncharacterized protein n=1 Tax=Zopfia rhizophila CBS 207.26 TaxID=1314779 RepID=A0A6A6DUU3_9PEZI|nr:hypothetical protein K469DRAFT_712998 [Zopfia rhizophila CBS 207.26]